MNLGSKKTSSSKLKKKYKYLILFQDKQLTTKISQYYSHYIIYEHVVQGNIRHSYGLLKVPIQY